MATKRKKTKKGKKGTTTKKTAKKRATKKKAAKAGFPTLKKMNAARKDFAEDTGLKVLTASKVKELVKSMGLHCGADFPEGLAKLVYAEVWKATKRCVSNDRKTLRASDL
jgi:hypothetical protein